MGVEKQTPQPQIGVVYAADDYKWLGQNFYIGGKKYKFLSVAVGTFIRTGSSSYFNGDYTVSQVNNVLGYINCYAPANVDCIGAAGYTLFTIEGDNILINKEGSDATSAANVFENARLVPYINGTMRCVNAYIDTSLTYAVTDTATCTISLQLAAAANLLNRISVGDIVNTNVGVYGSVAKIVNDSSLILAVTAQGVANATSVSAKVSMAIGGARKAHAVVTCANGIQYTINGINNTLNLYVCGAGAVFFTNANMAGALFKVGDRVTVANQTGYSVLSISSINNVNAFTVNASATVDQVGLLGSVINVNVYNYRAMVAL